MCQAIYGQFESLLNWHGPWAGLDTWISCWNDVQHKDSHFNCSCPQSAIHLVETDAQCIPTADYRYCTAACFRLRKDTRCKPTGTAAVT